MSILYVLIPLALGLLSIAVWALLWAIKSGQFDDLESHGWSVVLDDDQKPMPMADERDDPETDSDAHSGSDSGRSIRPDSGRSNSTRPDSDPAPSPVADKNKTRSSE